MSINTDSQKIYDANEQDELEIGLENSCLLMYGLGKELAWQNAYEAYEIFDTAQRNMDFWDVVDNPESKLNQHSLALVNVALGKMDFWTDVALENNTDEEDYLSLNIPYMCNMIALYEKTGNLDYDQFKGFMEDINDYVREFNGEK